MIKPVVTAKADTTIESAINTLHEKHVGSIVVVDDERRCEGIFTERDAIRMFAKKVSLFTPLKMVMTKNIITIREEASFAEAMALIVNHGIRHLPVVNGNKQLVGIISIRNFLDEVVGISR
jgi:CBS domain-containing protein